MKNYERIYKLWKMGIDLPPKHKEEVMFYEEKFSGIQAYTGYKSAYFFTKTGNCLGVLEILRNRILVFNIIDSRTEFTKLNNDKGLFYKTATNIYLFNFFCGARNIPHEEIYISSTKYDSMVLEKLFSAARTFNKFSDEQISEFYS